MNLLGPELVRDLVSLIHGAEADGSRPRAPKLLPQFWCSGYKYTQLPLTFIYVSSILRDPPTGRA
jgi:hypothetical protein